MAPPSAQERRPVSRRRWVLGALLGLVAVTWYLYPSTRPTEPEVQQGDPISYACSGDEPVRNVAVIGAGSAGASAAYYLRQYQSPCQPINITIYERNHYIGGRTTTVNAYDDPDYPVELGGSIFVQVNHNLVNAAREFGLSINSLQASGKLDTPEVLGVWDGEEFVFTQSDASNRYWNIAKLLWKYGYSPIRTQTLMKKTVGSFLKMYQPPYFPFKSLSKTASELGILGATAVTGEQYLESSGISSHFAHDIIQASTRVNYAQNLNQIHGLETMVCMATDGAMSIKGGNWQIFANMIAVSGAILHLNTSVTSITKDTSSGKYTIETSTPPLHPAQDVLSSSVEETNYDTIILASPLQSSHLEFRPPLPSPPAKIPYVSQHVTLFTSPYPLSRRYFNNPALMPTTILTTTTPPTPNEPDTFTSPPFYSISTLRTLVPPSTSGNKKKQPEYLYKIFSRAAMSEPHIRTLLDIPTGKEADEQQQQEVFTWLTRKQWEAYPVLNPTATFEDIRLEGNGKGEGGGGGGIWYTSGIESFISTMETSSLMGANVARLVVDGWWGDAGGAGQVEGEGGEL
ncbi:MAG: hypothetical protein LQ344_002407 [Seirophora lacunosa]|nr:MAG: hypothetical protein LQ344_002407 [Seirophora lacunosa]